MTLQASWEATASQRKTIARLCIIKRIDAPLEEPRMTMAEAGYLIRRLICLHGNKNGHNIIDG